MKRQLWALALVGAVLLSGTVAWADSEFYVIAAGPTAVGTKITSVPYTISTPGFYYLTGNLTYSDLTGNAITISSDDVTIDLMGFALTGGKLGTPKGVHGVSAGGLKNVEIRNGTVKNFQYAIADDFSTSTGFRVFNVRVIENTNGIILPGSGNLIKGCTVSNNALDGISTHSSIISGNVVANNGGRGIFVGARLAAM